MLLDRLAILEEVYALHTIVHHAGEAMYSRLQMIDFVNKLHRRAATIAPGASVLGHPNVVAEVARYVEVSPIPCHGFALSAAKSVYPKDLTRLVNDWADARVTPSPSECSDLVSEYSDHNPDMAYYQPDPVPLASENVSLPNPDVSLGLGILVAPPTHQQVQEVTNHIDSLSPAISSHTTPPAVETHETSTTRPPAKRSPSWAHVVKT
jgi:hypothetical protein